MAPRRGTAAILTVGTELTTGLQVDTNAPEIAAVLTAAGYEVAGIVSTGDEQGAAAAAIRRLVESADLVFVTGGLGPTHDDLTREAAAEALGLGLERDERIAEGLGAVSGRHRDPEAAAQVVRQADVLDGAEVLPATVGTAPGQIVRTPRGAVVLLPGPPREMRPMLYASLRTLGLESASMPLVLATTGLSESDVQVVAQRVIANAPGIGLTVLARPGEVRVVLVDRGAGDAAVAAVCSAVCDALGDACFSDRGETLAETVLRKAREASCTIATAESCTGGMIAAALTDVPGSSEVFVGGMVTYSNGMKSSALRVPASLLQEYGAVSRETAEAMARGAREATGADWTVSTTGVAGPGGGSEEKPVGTVWIAAEGPTGTFSVCRRFPGDRMAVRIKATAAALDLLRLSIVGIPL